MIWSTPVRITRPPSELRRRPPATLRPLDQNSQLPFRAPLTCGEEELFFSRIAVPNLISRGGFFMALLRYSPELDSVSNLLALQSDLERFLRNPGYGLGVSASG